MRIPQWVKPAVWGAIIGAVAIMIVGFWGWGWVTGSTAERMARERADAAVVAVLTPICVENFMKQPDAAIQLAEFQKTVAWQRRQFIEKGSWAKVPGSDAPHSAVANACADQLAKIKA